MLISYSLNPITQTQSTPFNSHNSKRIAIKWKCQAKITFEYKSGRIENFALQNIKKQQSKKPIYPAVLILGNYMETVG